MDLMGVFRSFFGIPRNRSERRERMPDEFYNEEEEREDYTRGERDPFETFVNPLEMERFFSQQMDDMLKNFGFGQGFFGGFPAMPDHPAIEQFPAIRQEEDEEESGGRDFMLKRDGSRKGYIDPDGPIKRDKDIGEVSPRELDELYEDQPKSSDRQTFSAFGSFFPNPWFSQPNEKGGMEHSFNFGRSVTQRTVRLPDGRIEEHKTVKDSDGRETTTVTKRFGDQSHTVTTIKHPDGTEEHRENRNGVSDNDMFANLPSSDSLRARNPGLNDKEKYHSLFSKFFGGREDS